jgi:hypothetical protein
VWSSVKLEAWAVGFTAGTRDVPGKKRPVTRDIHITTTTNNNNNKLRHSVHFFLFLFTCPVLTLRRVSPDSTLTNLHMYSVCYFFPSSRRELVEGCTTVLLLSTCPPPPLWGSQNVHVVGSILFLWLVKTRGFRGPEQDFFWASV